MKGLNACIFSFLPRRTFENFDYSKLDLVKSQFRLCPTYCSCSCCCHDSLLYLESRGKLLALFLENHFNVGFLPPQLSLVNFQQTRRYITTHLYTY